MPKEKSKVPRKASKSLLSPMVLARIQAIVTAASGLARMPSREQGGYVQGLLNKTPDKPRLEVLAIRRDDKQTTVTVVVSQSDGQRQAGSFTTRGVLTPENAAATGDSIASVLGVRGAGATCARELLKLLGEPVGKTRAFSRDLDEQLQITAGEVQR